MVVVNQGQVLGVLTEGGLVTALALASDSGSPIPLTALCQVPVLSLDGNVLQEPPGSQQAELPWFLLVDHQGQPCDRVMRQQIDRDHPISPQRENPETYQDLRQLLQGSPDLSFQAIFEQINVGLCQASLDGWLVNANPGLCHMLGYSHEELVQKSCQQITYPADLDLDLDQYQRLLAGQQNSMLVEKRYLHKDGHAVWVALTVCLVRDDQGQPLFSIGVSQDISDRKAAELALQTSHQHITDILESITDAFFALDQRWRFTYLNQRAEQMLLLPRGELLGENIWYQFPEMLGSLFSSRFRQAMGRRESTCFEELFQPLNSWYKVHVYPTQEGLAVYLQDITDRKQAYEKIEHQIRREQALNRVIQAIRRSLDLDTIFQTAALEVAHLLQAVQVDIQTYDAQNRCWKVVAEHCADETIPSLLNLVIPDDDTAISERLKRLEVPMVLEGQEIFISASIGISSNWTGSIEAVDFLRDADTAMYQAKNNGRGCSALFNPNMYEQVTTQLTLENDLQRALQRGELSLHYQPIVNLTSGQLVGFEALARWHHNRWGNISPAQFIPLAEETGQILSIGEWILRVACQQLQQWRQRYARAADLTMGVNLSVKQFGSPRLIAAIDEILAETGLSYQHLHLEITESALIDNPATAESILCSLGERGVQLCIDDFGTGYSSLSMVHQFPVQVLKIDRSFTHRLEVDHRGIAMMQSILALAQNMGMTAIAEGVETPSQLHHLRTLHCPFAQGFYFAKPLPAAEVALLFQEGPTWTLPQAIPEPSLHNDARAT